MMKRYISLAGALLIGTVVTKEAEPAFRGAIATKVEATGLKAAMPLQTQPAYKRAPVVDDKTSVTSDNSPFARAPVTSATTKDGEKTSNNPKTPKPHFLYGWVFAGLYKCILK